MPQVIEWKKPGPEDIVWKYPDETIEWGAQLIVHEWEVAVFFRDGKAYDVLGPGRHTLTTLNLPLLTKYITEKLGFTESPFKATVIFVSMRQFQGKFGGRTQTSDLAPLMYRGSYWFKVEDPTLFVVEVVGGQGIYTTEQVNEYLRGFFNERMMDFLAGFDLVTVYTKLDEVSFKAKALMIQEFKRVGLALIDLKFEGIDTEPEYREKLFWILKTGTPTYVLQMDTATRVAKELGKSPGASVGAGMMIIPPLFTPPPPAQPPSTPGAGVAPTPSTPPTQPPPSTKKCPNCGRDVPGDARFCPYCGYSFPSAATKVCPQCKKSVPGDAVFCPYCGYRFS